MFRIKKVHINDNTMTDIDILVLGNRGAGKTSLLATMLYNMNDLLESNGILFQPADEETDARLKGSIAEIENMFTSKGIVEVGEGIPGTDGFLDYNFNLAFSNELWSKKSDFSVHFHDYAGSILANGDQSEQYQILKEYFLKSQIIYILVDTPYLMEATRKTIIEYSAKDEILALFQKLDANGSDKLIVFVPTKCEYYLRSARTQDIADRIQMEFQGILSYIGQINKAEGREKYQLYITPVQTVGGLEFCRIEEREGTQVATFRRTKPNSQFKPVNTDLLLLFCLNYLFDYLFKQLTLQTEPKKMKDVMNNLIKRDEKKVLGSFAEKYQKLLSAKKTKDKKEELEKELLENFMHALWAFLSEYSKRGTIIKEICNEQVSFTFNDLYTIFSCKKNIQENYEKTFQRQFTQIYL